MDAELDYGALPARDDPVGLFMIASVGKGEQFTKGQMAASIGLTPKQYSSGGKERLLGIRSVVMRGRLEMR